MLTTRSHRSPCDLTDTLDGDRRLLVIGGPRDLQPQPQAEAEEALIVVCTWKEPRHSAVHAPSSCRSCRCERVVHAREAGRRTHGGTGVLQHCVRAAQQVTQYTQSGGLRGGGTCGRQQREARANHRGLIRWQSCVHCHRRRRVLVEGRWWVRPSQWVAVRSKSGATLRQLVTPHGWACEHTPVGPVLPLEGAGRVCGGEVSVDMRIGERPPSWSLDIPLVRVALCERGSLVGASFDHSLVRG